VDLIIEGHPAELEWLQGEIEKQIGRDAHVEPVTEQDPDKLSEPITVAIIVALGGPKIVKAVRDVLKRRYQHIEEMKQLDVQLRESKMKHEFKMTELSLRLQENGKRDRKISEDDLETLEADG
jgi:hypothetical protein